MPKINVRPKKSDFVVGFPKIEFPKYIYILIAFSVIVLLSNCSRNFAVIGEFQFWLTWN
jgi:hypothetical protein